MGEETFGASRPLHRPQQLQRHPRRSPKILHPTRTPSSAVQGPPPHIVRPSPTVPCLVPYTRSTSSGHSGTRATGSPLSSPRPPRYTGVLGSQGTACPLGELTPPGQDPASLLSCGEDRRRLIIARGRGTGTRGWCSPVQPAGPVSRTLPSFVRTCATVVYPCCHGRSSGRTPNPPAGVSSCRVGTGVPVARSPPLSRDGIPRSANQDFYRLPTFVAVVAHATRRRMTMSERPKRARWTPEEYRQKPRELDYSLADEIVFRIANGELLPEICSERAMPMPAVFLQWTDDDPELRSRYERARLRGAEINFDEALIAAHDPDASRAGAMSRAYLAHAERSAPEKFAPRTVQRSLGKGDADSNAGYDAAAELRAKLDGMAANIAAGRLPSADPDNPASASPPL